MSGQSSPMDAANPPLSSSFTPSSWSSNLGVAEALASYRRSQYIITGQNVASSIDTDEQRDEIDEESQYGTFEDEESPASFTGDREEELFVDGLEQEGDWRAPESWRVTDTLGQRPQAPELSRQTTATVRPPSADKAPVSQSPIFNELSSRDERRPLLHKATSSTSVLQLPRRRKEEILIDSQPSSSGSQPLRRPSQGSLGQKTRLQRKLSTVSTRSAKVSKGKSTFGQTLFNSVAILLGFGMLAEPFAFAYAGWIGGSILIIFYGFITCYTAKILAHIMADDPQIRTYADIGNKAFGQRSRFLVSSLFCLELFAVGVVLVTLYADSLHSILPRYSADTYKVIGLLILIPSAFFPLSLLSFASILGIISTLLIIFVLLFDGVTKQTAPGSIWDPAPTRLSYASLGDLGIAFGLFMAGFSGHAVLPSLERDMAEPHRFDSMINYAFMAATVIYAVIGSCGYLMFGIDVSDEVSVDMLHTSGYNTTINQIAVWSLVIMPLTKFALSTRPVIITLEIMLGLEQTSASQMSDHGVIEGLPQTQSARPRFSKDMLVIIERAAFTTLSVGVSIFFPDFSSMMAFLGSFSAFMLCVIGPVSAKLALQKKCGIWDAILLAIAVVMAIWGTVSAFFI